MSAHRRTLAAWVLLAGGVLAAAAACDEHDHGEEDDRGAAAGHGARTQEGHSEPTRVHLSAEQLADLDLETARVRRGALGDSVDLPAEVRWNADELVHVSPSVSGVVASVERTLGDAVEAGDLLCVLDSREMGEARMEYLSDLGGFALAEADFTRARAVHDNTVKLLAILDARPAPDDALAQAADLMVGDDKNALLTTYTRVRVNERTLERTEGLLEKKIASEADFLREKGAYEISLADWLSTREEITFDLELEYLRAQRVFELARTELRNSERALYILGATEDDVARLRSAPDEAPRDIARNEVRAALSGVVISRHLTRGELVTPTSQIFTIADPSVVWVIGRVYERDLKRVRVGLEAAVRLDALPGEALHGKVDYLASELDRETRSVEARVVLRNDDGRLRPGMFGSLTVFTAHDHDAPLHDEALLVPVSALQRSGASYFVYHEADPGEFREVPVRVITRSRTFAEVTGDLEEGDAVVTSETLVLETEANAESLGGGHSH